MRKRVLTIVFCVAALGGLLVAAVPVWADGWNGGDHIPLHPYEVRRFVDGRWEDPQLVRPGEMVGIRVSDVDYTLVYCQPYTEDHERRVYRAGTRLFDPWTEPYIASWSTYWRARPWSRGKCPVSFRNPEWDPGVSLPLLQLDLSTGLGPGTIDATWFMFPSTTFFWGPPYTTLTFLPLPGDWDSARPVVIQFGPSSGGNRFTFSLFRVFNLWTNEAWAITD